MLAGSIMSLAGLMIVKHDGGAPAVTNSTVEGGIHTHDSVFDLSRAGGSIMFLEAFAGLALFVMIVCGGVHCIGWCHHFHGAHRARRDHEYNLKWSAIEQHFLSRFGEMSG